MNECLLCFNRAPFEHTHLDNGVLLGSARRIHKIARIEPKEALSTFIFRHLQHLDHTTMNHIRKLGFDPIEMCFQGIDLNLRHKFLKYSSISSQRCNALRSLSSSNEAKDLAVRLSLILAMRRNHRHPERSEASHRDNIVHP